MNLCNFVLRVWEEWKLISYALWIGEKEMLISNLNYSRNKVIYIEKNMPCSDSSLSITSRGDFVMT